MFLLMEIAFVIACAVLAVKYLILKPLKKRSEQSIMEEYSGEELLNDADHFREEEKRMREAARFKAQQTIKDAEDILKHAKDVKKESKD